ncbi:NAD-dependent epimerase/dehydratase family protein [Pedobacter sandarakinus]|uniref:NAD-dependent epimerase/dehydratase family protein n=1 Tax=Pedobacter sandarakinus TaxID=353156 RepID=UPI002246D66C|nr:NAD-dependent epimerase/dehydratase family protein [Pedobacter sandarakinus]MCX2574013.1 NAD-dependent epimerase/dehydratase family protein [Pedobacter sandarakinus]
MGDVKSILITGGNGFLGSHLIGYLLELKYTLILLTRPKSDLSKISRYLDRIQIVDGTNEEMLKLKFEENRIDAVIHLATDYGRTSTLSQVIQTNVLLPLKLVELAVANGTKVFINTDTFIAKQNSGYDYLNSYAKTKFIIKDLLADFSKYIKIVNMKLEHIYGENDGDNKFVTQIVKSLIRNQSELDLTEGMQKRDFIYVLDVAAAYGTVLKNVEVLNSYVEFEIGSGISTSIKSFVQELKDLTDSTTILNFGALPTRSGEFIESKANNKSLLDLGWCINFDLKAGLMRTLSGENVNYLKKI